MTRLNIYFGQEPRRAYRPLALDLKSLLLKTRNRKIGFDLGMGFVNYIRLS
jgi:hypothetical protein